MNEVATSPPVSARRAVKPPAPADAGRAVAPVHASAKHAANHDVPNPAPAPAHAGAKHAAHGDISDPAAGSGPQAIIHVLNKSELDDRKGRYLISGTFLAILVAFLISRRGYYTPGDNVGYYMGLVGGVMMLLLLTYPLRKYLHGFPNWGPVKHWF